MDKDKAFAVAVAAVIGTTITGTIIIISVLKKPHTDNPKEVTSTGVEQEVEETLPPNAFESVVITDVVSEAWYPVDDRLEEVQLVIKGNKVYSFTGKKIGSIDGNTASITGQLSSGPVELQYKISGDTWTLSDKSEKYLQYGEYQIKDGLAYNTTAWYFIKDGKLYYHNEVSNTDSPCYVSADSVDIQWNISESDTVLFEERTDDKGNTFYSSDWKLNNDQVFQEE